MAKKDFDDLVKVIRAVVNNVAAATLSIEIDLELPRGYVAKIKKVEFRMDVTGVAMRGGVVAATPNNAWAAALVLDPDDAVTIVIPVNAVEHDVLADWGFVIAMDAADDIINWYETAKLYEFEPEDAITARNMRFNTQQLVATPVNQTEVRVYYTLEKVNDDDILALLDIL